MNVVFLGLSITSSWGNGHATNYRALLRALRMRGHDVLFLERDVPWYASERDFDDPAVRLYGSVDELRRLHGGAVGAADLVVVGSFVPDGAEVADWVTSTARGRTAFYDIDTPVTLAQLEDGTCAYLAPEQVPRFDLYLSFSGGPLLRYLEHEYGARNAVPFYCLVDPETYRPLTVERRWDLGYLGTFSPDRQPKVDALLVEPACAARELRFVVAGPQYPDGVEWPANVERIEHLPPVRHPAFYSAQRFTLNVTRAEMVRWGWSPSVRLFEAAACGVPIVSDRWDGLDHVFVPGKEILIVDDADAVLRVLRDLSEDERRAIAVRARRRVLAEHTAERRVEELESLVEAVPA